MNILQHIEAGHYPKDEKDRAIVPMRSGGRATILATDRDAFSGPDREPIIGMVENGSVFSWWECGEHSRRMPSDCDLLPPTPRKVEVKRYLVPCTSRYAEATFISATAADEYANEALSRVVVLTGSYEKPWS